jgi:hypothetical protein
VTGREAGSSEVSDDATRLQYRLLTGVDDRAFCEKVSGALSDGYVLHGAPSITARPDGTIMCAQAVVLPAP